MENSLNQEKKKPWLKGLQFEGSMQIKFIF
jgi:hypothetical protein